MELIEEFNLKDKVTFYRGIDMDIISKHPKDGSNGMMVIFIENESTSLNNNYIILFKVPIKQTKSVIDILMSNWYDEDWLIYKRNQKIDKLLNDDSL